MNRIRTITALLALALPLSAPAEGRPVATAVPLSGVILLDGILDDEAWQHIAPISGFVERKPSLRAQPAVQTLVRIAFDAEALYFAIDCQDDEPENIRALTQTRDSFSLFSDDAIGIKLDIALDSRTTLGFAMNPAGARLDYRGINEGNFQVEFDANWTAAANRHSEGWSAEFRLPWRSLGIHPGNPPPRIGLNLTRDHSRRNATYDWALMPPGYSPIAASQYGTLEGLDALASLTRGADGVPLEEGAQVSLAPHLSTGVQIEDSAIDAPFKTGLDIHAQVGADWRAHVSVNTDFAHVDLDNQVVNLTQFGLFLPEKRDFFLQDLEVFTFGVPQEGQLLHSRRIGLVDDREVPILVGTKLVGRPSESLRVGLLQVITRPVDATPWTMHLVGRGLFEMEGGSNLGWMVTHRQSLDARHDRNTVLGVDGSWRSTTLPLILTAGNMFSLTGRGAFAPQSATGGARTLRPDQVAPGAFLNLVWRGELWRSKLGYAYFHPGLRSDLGFFRRVGLHQTKGHVAAVPRIEAHGIEKLRFNVGAEVATNSDDGELLDWSTGTDARIVWQKGFFAGAYAVWNVQTVTEEFTVGDDTLIAAGVYEGLHTGITAGTPHVWPVSLTAELQWQQYFDGTRWGTGASIQASPHRVFRLELDGRYDFVTFEDDRPDFHAAIINGRMTLGITPDLGLRLSSGWDHLNDHMQLQARLRLTYLPGSEFFAVYQVDMDTESGKADFQSAILKWTVLLE